VVYREGVTSNRLKKWDVSPFSCVPIFLWDVSPFLIAVRKENGLAPQAMDWFSWFVLEYKMNPSKRALQAYIKGEAK